MEEGNGKSEITEEGIIKSMKKFQDSDDTEMAHYGADILLCDFLRHLGFDKVADAYDEIGKWYA